VAGAWKTVQEEQSRRSFLSGLTVEDFNAINVSSAVIDVHEFPLDFSGLPIKRLDNDNHFSVGLV
jgi:hypothetical protein